MIFELYITLLNVEWPTRVISRHIDIFLVLVPRGRNEKPHHFFGFDPLNWAPIQRTKFMCLFFSFVLFCSNLDTY
jgi:hypothetical protein